eukprot:1648851-Amphidinium_carterae.1
MHLKLGVPSTPSLKLQGLLGFPSSFGALVRCVLDLFGPLKPYELHLGTRFGFKSEKKEANSKYR